MTEAGERTWPSPRYGGSRTRIGLSVISAGAIISLAVLRIADAPTVVQYLGQVIFLAAFASLAILDFRASVAIAIVELAVFGAGGHWTQFAGGPSGRVVLDGIVMIRALATVGIEWRRNGRLALGRYAPHALVLGVVIPLVWMSLGLINGNRPSDIFGDGDGLAFIAFTLALTLLIQRGQAAWLRQWLLVACAVNAVAIGALVLVTSTGLVPMGPALHRALMDQLAMGGNFGVLSNGAYRMYLGSGLYLQVGLALVTWRLISSRPRAWMWALYALLWADVLASYTRGYWIGSVLAVGVVLALGATNLRRPAVLVACSVLLFTMSSGAGLLVGFSLPDYVLNRTASTLATGPQPTVNPTTIPGSSGAAVTSAVPTDASTPPPDIAGQVSNQVKVDQLKVLVGHIIERPLFGWGFGTVAQDYAYGDSYSYELAYLDLLYKTGIVGFLLFVSYPLRLLLDGLAGRIGRHSLPGGVSSREVSVAVAILVSLFVVGGTNPYLLAAFGMFPVLATIAWLEPSRDSVTATSKP